MQQINVTAGLDVDHAENDTHRHLYLGGTRTIQGSINLEEPFALVHHYSKSMMAWLLLLSDVDSPKHVMQLGLGAGSLTKFCSQIMGAKTTAVELNPQVVQTCYDHFQLPPNSEKLQVVIADAEDAIKDPAYLRAVDALQVDVYDGEALAPALDSVSFYTDCFNTLTDTGCMAVNIMYPERNIERSFHRIAEVFGADSVWALTAPGAGNAVLLAQRTPTRPTSEEMVARAEHIQKMWGLPAYEWAQDFHTAYPDRVYC